MQSLAGFARKYAIMEELDGGFGAGSTPEAFVRLDSWEGRIQASLHVKGLKQGPYTYKLYLIFSRNEKLVPLLAGSMTAGYSGMQNGFEIDAETLKNNAVKPESVRYAAITAESNEKKSVPLFSSFEKSYRWDESIRQLLLKKPLDIETINEETEPRSYYKERSSETAVPAAQHTQAEAKPNLYPTQQVNMIPHREEDRISSSYEISAAPVNNRTEPEAIPASANNGYATQRQVQQEDPHKTSDFGTGSYNDRSEFQGSGGSYNRCDINKLEGLLQNNFESFSPFKRARGGYSWYRVSDLAKLSNIMYLSGVNVPVFANPKILVGLFKFKHILAGLYRGDNGANYYVIGVPAKDDNDNKPFENACRWVSVSESNIRDMGGYWLVYVSLRTGEIVV